MERSHLWHSAFKTNLGLLDRNLAGVTDAHLRQRPADNVACPGWILGHLVRSRNLIFKLVGRPRPEDESLACYGRGSTGAECAHELVDLVARLKSTSDDFKVALLAVEDWDRPVMNPAVQAEQPLEQVVAFLYMHEAYHLGQLGLARKLMGLAGGI